MKYHEEYKSTAYWNNDIAVVKVSPPLTLNSKVQLTKLPADGAEPAGGAQSVAIGWGSACGDSGGALLVDGVQVGVTSWTRLPCATYPAVWTKVSHYRSWIKENTGVKLKIIRKLDMRGNQLKVNKVSLMLMIFYLQQDLNNLP
ncbi:hypothetical protein C0J52_26736 [Blattella germanica]|nr:hypothetical protein C0J52_26736 [Blattella germanica]